MRRSTMPAPLPQPPSGPHSVLVIDDDAGNRALARFTLERAGYRVLLASDGPTGIDLLHRERPALVLLDFMMPGMDGPAVAQRIRACGAARDVPIIMLTASDGEEYIEAAFAAGADDYLIKPFNRRILATRVDS